MLLLLLKVSISTILVFVLPSLFALKNNFVKLLLHLNHKFTLHFQYYPIKSVKQYK